MDFFNMMVAMRREELRRSRMLDLYLTEESIESGVTYRGLQEDNNKRLVAWESKKGQAFRKQADSLRNKGTEAVKTSDYERAKQLYTDALNVAVNVHNNDEQVATIFSDRSFVCRKLRDHQQAARDAAMGTRLRPDWFTGHIRFLRALKCSEHYDKALMVGMESAASDKWTYEEKISILTEIALFLPNMTDLSTLQHYTVGRDCWNRVLQNLVQKDAWETISFLLQGRQGSPAIVYHFEASNLKLSGLLEKCSPEQWKDWGERLALYLLQAGAKKNTMCKDNKHAIHAALRVGMRTGQYGLLQYLFRYHIPVADRDRVDDDGNTLLHLACRENFSSKEHIVKLLLQHKLDPSIMNKDEKKPLDLLPVDDPHRSAIYRVFGIRDSAATLDKQNLHKMSHVGETRSAQEIQSGCVQSTRDTGDIQSGDIPSTRDTGDIQPVDIQSTCDTGHAQLSRDSGNILSTRDTGDIQPGDIQSTCDTGDVQLSRDTGDIQSTCDTADIQSTCDIEHIQSTRHTGDVQSSCDTGPSAGHVQDTEFLCDKASSRTPSDQHCSVFDPEEIRVTGNLSGKSPTPRKHSDNHLIMSGQKTQSDKAPKPGCIEGGRTDAESPECDGTVLNDVPQINKNTSGNDCVASHDSNKSVRAKAWSKAEVGIWLADERLTFLSKEKVSGLCGEELIELKILQQESPDAFYHLLSSSFQLSFSQILQLSRAIRQLT